MLAEAMLAPYALEIRDLLKAAAERSRSPEEMQANLRELFQAFLDQHLRTDLKVEFLLLPLTSFIGGMFRAPGDYNGAVGEFDLPPLPPNTMQIGVCVDHAGLHDLMTRQHNATQRFADVIQHEIIHARQYIQAGGNPQSLIHMTPGRTRPTIDGKRVGKRGGSYDPTNTSVYLSDAKEIEAMAAEAAGNMIARVRREPPERQRQMLFSMLRGLQSDSYALMQYREIFLRLDLGSGNRAARKRARQKVWKMFRLKLAKHLLSYLPQL